jgi:hypothetical protein
VLGWTLNTDLIDGHRGAGLIFPFVPSVMRSSSHPIKIRESTQEIDIQTQEPKIHETLAPSFGDIKNAQQSIKELDEKLKVMLLVFCSFNSTLKTALS